MQDGDERAALASCRSAHRSSTSIWWAMSRNVVGSSSSRIGVCCASTIASHTRWRWPPESSSTSAAGEVVDARRRASPRHRALVVARPLAQQPLVRVAAARDEVGDRDRRPARPGLRQQAEPPRDLLGRVRRDRLAVEQHGARARLEHPRERPQQRRLAARVRARRSTVNEPSGIATSRPRRRRARRRRASSARRRRRRSSASSRFRASIRGTAARSGRRRRATPVTTPTGSCVVAEQPLAATQSLAEQQHARPSARRAADAGPARRGSAARAICGAASATKHDRPGRRGRHGASAPRRRTSSASRGALDRARPSAGRVVVAELEHRAAGARAAARTGSRTASASGDRRTCSQPRPLRLPISQTCAACASLERARGQQVVG